LQDKVYLLFPSILVISFFFDSASLMVLTILFFISSLSCELQMSYVVYNLS